MGLPKPQQWDSTDQKVEQDNPQFISKRNNSDAQDVFRPIPGLLSSAVISTHDKIFWNQIDVLVTISQMYMHLGMVISDILDVRRYLALKCVSFEWQQWILGGNKQFHCFLVNPISSFCQNKFTQGSAINVSIMNHNVVRYILYRLFQYI